MSPNSQPVSPAAPLATPDRPWLGLAAYTAACRDYFFGRDAEIRELADRVRRAPLTVLYGVSGYGKSSLIGAGLIPSLQEAGHPIVLLRRCYDDLSERPLTADILADVAREIPGAVPISGSPESPAGTLWEFFHDRRQPWFAPAEDADSPRPSPVLILDQFEEIFVKGEDRSTGDAAADARARTHARDFLADLADLVENRPPAALRQRLDTGTAAEKRALIAQFHFQARPVRVALVLREDYLARLERWRRVMPGMMEHRLELRLLSGPQAFRAVFEPGTKRPHLPPIIPREVAESIVRAAAGAAPDVPLDEIDAVPPILSLLCERLNSRRLAGAPSAAPGPHAEASQAKTDAAAAHAVSISPADFTPGEASRILADFYAEKTRHHPRVLREYLEDKLCSDSGLRETVTLDSALAALRSIADARARLFSLVDDRILVVEERHGISRVEFSHDTLARLALERRTQRYARIRRRRALAWTAAALVVAGISLSLMFWALRERGRAVKQTAVADAERDKVKQQLREASRSDFATAQARLAEGKWQEGIAYLGRAIRNDPENRNAQDALWMAVRYGQPDASPLLIRSIDGTPSLRSAAFSPDCSVILTIGDDDTARLWDAETGKPIGEPMRHRNFIPGMEPKLEPLLLNLPKEKTTLSPLFSGTPRSPFPEIKSTLRAVFSPDGSRLVTFGVNKDAQQWDAKTGRRIGDPLRHKGKVETAVYSPDGNRLITGGGEDAAQVWNAKSGQPFGPALADTGGVYLAAFSPDGTRIITTGTDNTATIWDAAQGRPTGVVVQHRGRITSASFSTDNSRIVTGSWDQTAQVRDATTGEPIGAPMQHGNIVTIASFSPDGTRVVTAGWDNTAHLWDAVSGQSIGTGMEHKAGIANISFSPDGTRVLTGSSDNTARIWEATTGKAVGPPLRHSGGVASASFDREGTRVLTADYDGAARLWDAGSSQSAGLPLPHAERVRCAKFSPDSSRIVTACDDHRVRVWDAGNPSAPQLVLKHDSYVTDAEFSPDGSRIVSASWDGTARQWDAGSGAPVGPALKHDGYVEFARYSPDGSQILTGIMKNVFSREGNSASLSDAATGVMRPSIPHSGDLVAGDFSPDGSRFLTASGDRTVRQWDSKTGLAIGRPITHEKQLWSACYSRDGALILTTSGNDTAAWIWHASDGTRAGSLEETDGVGWAGASPDGSRFLTCSTTSARLWDAKSRQRIGAALEHRALVKKAAVSPDGSLLATVGDDFTARVWRIESGEPLDGPAAERLAAACAGAQLDPQLGSLRLLALSERHVLRQSLSAELAQMPNWQTALAATFPQDAATALVSPPTTMTVRQAANSFLSTLKTDAILEVLRIDPGNPLVPFAFAHVETAESVLWSPNPVRAGWLVAYGMKRLPPDTGADDLRLAARLVAAVAKVLPEMKSTALSLLDRAAKISPEDEAARQLRDGLK